MAIQLQKGSSLNLTKKEPALKKIMIGLGWELKQGAQLDLDASVFMVGANGKLPSDEYLIFYNNLKSPDGSVQHTGDNRTGLGDEDDEMILVNLPLVSQNVTEILVVATIHDAVARRHNFGLLTDAYIRIVDVETKREILRYDLDAEFGTNTDVEFGKLHKQNGEWYFTALGVGNNKGLEGYVNIYV
ncbi:tellurium resistance protein TerD [Flexibacter flexilis DSM 6793]|uniref:Tellurium resistance protein TerD n=1 Tax=Flexibacter flexilis DSM 6793 TaxID=927664 RepID=A0A1I1N7R5_9BACT|nr:TerD family protein [Flexibacter flexilis]SFC90823.1 tellurium resistance protein TerD [Flexibacter flexilis DSM 6793]